MNVRAHGYSIDLEPKEYISFLPAKTQYAWLGTSTDAGLKLIAGCILPPEKRTINLSYYGQYTPDGSDSFLEYSSPSILWTYTILPLYGGIGQHHIECRLFLWKIHQEQILKKAYRIGNICHDGRVCWGMLDPLNLRKANIRFWSSSTSWAYLSSGSHGGCQTTECSPWEIGALHPTCQKSECNCCHYRCQCWSGMSPASLQRHTNFILNYDVEKNLDPWTPLEIPPNCLFTDQSPDAFYFDLQDKKNPILGWGVEGDDEKTWKIWTPKNSKIISKKDIKTF